MHFIHVTRCTFLSCSLPKCADNMYKKNPSLYTNIWPVAWYFFFAHFFSVVVCIWWEYRLWLCAWLLRANVIDTECMCMKNCMHITVFLQAKICKTILYQQFECTCVCMYEHMECARQIVWFVWSSLFNAIDILANTGRCVVDRTFKYIFFLFILTILFILFLSFVWTRE